MTHPAWVFNATPGCSYCPINSSKAKKTRHRMPIEVAYLYAICPECERPMNPERYERYLELKELN